ncbi:MAG: TolC family protein, partial [Bacteroidales bacterium]|nr:TolC family protein [Bacteroidales bacterium]
TSASTNMGVTANMELFTGMRRPNQVKSQKYELMAATENLELAKRNISIQVAAGYLQALYSKGIVDVERRQVELDKEALARAEALYEAGKKPKSEVATAEAQVAVSELSLTEAIGNETMSRLDLMQLLNLEGDVTNFSVVEIDTTSLVGDVAPASLVFEQAVENHPSIMGAKYNLESSKYQIGVAKSQYMPSVSLSASYNNSYYHLYDSEFKNNSFGKQLDLNGSEYIGINVSIPIFNRFQTRNNVRQARLQKESREVALNEAKQDLLKEIQQAYWNARKARDNYHSAQKAHASTELAYSYEAERYAQGKGTAYDLQQARTRLEKTAQDELQARYEFLMRVKILEFYNGVPM